MNEDHGDAAGPSPNPWLVTVDTNGYELLRIDATDAATELICALEPDGARYTSSSFGPSGRLFVTYKVDASDTAPDRLAVLDPCTCEKEVVAEYGFGGAAGLAWKGETLYALSHSADELLELDPSTGAADVIGGTGFDIRNHGASWSEAEGAIVVLEGSEDRLYTVDVLNRARGDLGSARVRLQHRRLEVHPQTARMYACKGDAVLYEIDRLSAASPRSGRSTIPGTAGTSRRRAAPSRASGRESPLVAVMLRFAASRNRRSTPGALDLECMAYRPRARAWAGVSGTRVQSRSRSLVRRVRRRLVRAVA